MLWSGPIFCLLFVSSLFLSYSLCHFPSFLFHHLLYITHSGCRIPGIEPSRLCHNLTFNSNRSSSTNHITFVPLRDGLSFSTASSWWSLIIMGYYRLSVLSVFSVLAAELLCSPTTPLSSSWRKVQMESRATWSPSRRWHDQPPPCAQARLWECLDQPHSKKSASPGIQSMSYSQLLCSRLTHVCCFFVSDMAHTL